MPYSVSPNMSLPVPEVGTTPGPEYAQDGLNASLTIIDQHDHTPGNGVAITPSGLNLNTDTNFQSNDAIALRSTRFTAQAAPLGTALDLSCAYVSGVDLYYNDGNGNQIRITQSGSIAGVSGSIANLVSPASVTYVSGTPAFVFQSDASTPADLDGGALVLRNILANSKGITLTAPNALAANYSLTLPPAPPATTKIMTMDASGNVAVVYGVDNSTIEVSSNNLQVKDLGISTAKIAASAVTTAKIDDGAVTKVKQAPVGEQHSVSLVSFSTTSTSFVTVTGCSATITTTGRPIQLILQSGAAAGYIYASTTVSGGTAGNQVALLGELNFFDSTNSASLYTNQFGSIGRDSFGNTAVYAHYVPSGAFATSPIAIAAGTYTFTTRIRVTATQTGQMTVTVGVNSVLLSVREL